MLVNHELAGCVLEACSKILQSNKEEGLCACDPQLQTLTTVWWWERMLVGHDMSLTTRCWRRRLSACFLSLVLKGEGGALAGGSGWVLTSPVLVE